jgi:PAS domain S-box-containing protein
MQALEALLAGLPPQQQATARQLMQALRADFEHLSAENATLRHRSTVPAAAEPDNPGTDGASLHFDELLHSLDVAAWEYDLQAQQMTFMNGRATELSARLSFQPEDKDSWLQTIYPADRESTRARFLLAMASEEHFSHEYRLRFAHNEECWIRNDVRIIRDAAGQPVRLRGLAIDITERKKDEEAQRFLSEAGAELTRSLDYETTLQRVAQLAVQSLTDLCMVYVDDMGDGSIRLLAVAPEAVAQQLPPERWLSYPLDELRTVHPLFAALQQGESYMMSDVSDAALQQLAVNDTHLGSLRSLNISSLMAVPRC